MAIPIFALIVASTMSSGGVDSMLLLLETTVRGTVTVVLDLVRSLF